MVADMANTYAMARLLEHGALTRGELIEITGWRHYAVDRAAERLLVAGIMVRSGGARRYRYALATAPTRALTGAGLAHRRTPRGPNRPKRGIQT